MPHKRAKRSVREAERSTKGADHAPSKDSHSDALSSEPLPKAFARAINAAQVRAEYHAKRKLGGEDTGEGETRQAKRRKTGKAEDDGMRIRPGETLAHFNKRIEGDMRPLVKNAIQSSRATERAQKKTDLTARGKAKKASKTADDADDDVVSSKSKSAPKTPTTSAPPPEKPKDFARTSTSAPRRLNDIAQAPPDLSALVRKAQSRPGGGKVGVGKEKAKEVVSPAQQLQLAQAREDAILRYRELKARRAGAGADS
ncbi:hypothetical protein MKEN_00178100 [Mycena kentingensis (nom. inval.)]|nr:hypothetical protein MKEN_00178100 [Mycena kentingensis (nom. inval.)]